MPSTIMSAAGGPKIFADIKDEYELKQKLKSMVKTVHPDAGGNAEEFNNIKTQYHIARFFQGGLQKRVNSWANNGPDFEHMLIKLEIESLVKEALEHDCDKTRINFNYSGIKTFEL